MNKHSMTCAHCEQEFTADKKRKYCTEQCKSRFAYARALERAPKCSRCGGPHQREGKNPRATCNKCCAETNATPTINRECGMCGQVSKTKSTRDNFTCTGCRGSMKEQGKRVCANCSKVYPWTKRNLCGPCRHTKDDVLYHKTCEFCAKAFTTQDNRSRYCSRQCFGYFERGCSRSTEINIARSIERQTRMWIGHTIASKNGGAWVSGPCAWCGDNFTGRAGSSYCSNRCKLNASWKRRYDRRGEFKVSEAVRQAIYKRDGWTCQLCKQPVPKDIGHNERLSPTLDHIIPQSMQLIPDHSPTNLRLAHLICNAKRGNRMEYELTV